MSGGLPIPPYRPMGLGQILDRVLRLLRANFRLLMGIAAVPGLTMLITYGMLLAAMGPSLISAMRENKPEEMFHQAAILSAVFFPLMVVYLVVFAVYLAAASYAAVLADRGTRVTFSDAYQVACSRVGHYVLLTLAIYAVTFLPAFLLEIPILVSSALMGAQKATPNPAFILLFPLLIFLILAAFIGGALVALRLSLAFAASIFESLGVKQAIRRSWTLTRGALGRIFLVALVIYAAIYIATMVLIFGAMIVGVTGFFLLGPHDHASAHSITVFAICAFVAYLAVIGIITMGTWAGFTTAFGVIYNDQRFRIDGASVAQGVSGVPG